MYQIASREQFNVDQGNDVDEQVLWEGTKQSLTNLASGGKVIEATYKITTQFIYVDEGVLRGSSEQIPLWAVKDLDVKQSIVQKTRGVGDVVIDCEHSEYTGRTRIVFDSVKEPKTVRDLINQHSKMARLDKQRIDQTVTYLGTPVGAPVAAAPPSTQAADPIERVTKRADLYKYKAGVLTDEEFAAQKAKLLA